MSDKMFYWRKFCSLQRWSFILNSSGGVASWANRSGNWNDHYEVSELIAEMEDEINRLKTLVGEE